MDDTSQAPPDGGLHLLRAKKKRRPIARAQEKSKNNVGGTEDGRVGPRVSPPNPTFPRVCEGRSLGDRTQLPAANCPPRGGGGGGGGLHWMNGGRQSLGWDVLALGEGFNWRPVVQPFLEALEAGMRGLVGTAVSSIITRGSTGPRAPLVVRDEGVLVFYPQSVKAWKLKRALTSASCTTKSCNTLHQIAGLLAISALKISGLMPDLVIHESRSTTTDDSYTDSALHSANNTLTGQTSGCTLKNYRDDTIPDKV